MFLLQTALYVTVMMIGMKAVGRCDSYITRLGITMQGLEDVWEIIRLCLGASLPTRRLHTH